MSRAWILNLDAEHELELGRRHTPSRDLLTRMRVIAAGIARTLDPHDVVLAPDLGLGPAKVDSSLTPRAWCPTPRALDAFERAGLGPPLSPAPGILRTVNERGFAHALAGAELAGTLRATDLDGIASHVARPSITGGWMLKRAFGVAGRGQRPVHPGPLSETDRAWVAASLRRGALYVEPRVEIVRELSVHAWATPTRVDVRSIREPMIRARAWVSSEPARALGPVIERALLDAAERAGRALVEAGYHGPYGVDAYVWRTPSGSLVTRTISEINARYCMGWDARDGWDPPR